MSNVGTFRYRVQLTSTIKEGWRVGDATVEFTESVPGSTDAPGKEIARRLKQIIEEGEAEAAQMNQQKHLATTTIVTAHAKKEDQS